jgi:hypothetical protein
MNPLLLDTMLKEKRRELLEEAARQRLVTIYNADNPGWWARSQLVLGDFLIRQGEKIKARYSRPLALDNDICRGD